ncbi:MAG TPA: YCF48-related protein [Bacteroidia bacterium]|nr:YCF48-related protein [Bacteroidia bacterium]
MNNAHKTGNPVLKLLFATFILLLVQCEKPAVIPTIFVEKVYTAGTHLSSVFFIDATSGFAGGNDGILLVTTDGGISWQQASLQAGEDCDFNCIAFPTRDTGFASGMENNNSINSGPAIYRTYNGGQSWQFIGGPFDMRFTAFPTKLIGYMDSYGNGIEKTTDGGQSWNTLSGSPPSSFGYSGLYFATKDLGFLGTSSYPYRTTNGGTSWSILSLPSFEYEFNGPTDYDFSDALHGVAVFSRGDIDVTADGGSTWTNVFDAMNDHYYPLNAVATPSSDFMIAGGINYLAASANGVDWEQYYQQDGTSFPGEVSDIHFYDSQNGYAVTREGSIYRLKRGN